MENRIKIALEFLKDGQSFTVGNLRLDMDGSNLLIVTGWSRYLNFSNLTKDNSWSELMDIKAVFGDMVKSFKDLEQFITGKSIEYILCYDDEGKASIEICSEKNGIVKYEIELK